MKSAQRFISRRGHSLVELITAVLCSAILLAGLGTVMRIAWLTADSPSASASRLDSFAAVRELADEIRTATMILQHVDETDEQVLEFIVADRDGDGCAERIRYDWPLHPAPDLLESDVPPRVYKSIRPNEADNDELVTWVVCETPPANDGEDLGDIPFRVELVSPSPPGSLPYFTYAKVRLRIDAAGHSEVDSAVPLLNHPELLSAYWRADFDLGADPTAVDLDASGNDDWALVTGEYQTFPANDFTGVTVVEARCRDTSSAAGGATVRINADRNGAFWGSLGVKVELQIDGSQTLTLFQGAADTTLQVVENLSSDPVCVRLTILPQSNAVTLHVNEQNIGQIYGLSYVYTPYSPTTTRSFVAFTPTATAIFDYVEVRTGAVN